MLLRLVPVCALFLFLLQPVASAQDASDLVVRMSTMEQQLRQMTGQIEQLQHENRQLKEQLRGLGVQPAEVPTPDTAPAPASVPSAGPEAKTENGVASPLPSATAPDAPPPEPQRDVFDPTSHPAAPGAPQPLGTTAPSRPLAETERQQEQSGYRIPGGAIAEKPSAALNGGNGGGTRAALPNGPSVAATGSGDPRADYEEAHNQFAQGRYREAEMGFRKFLQSHPRDQLVPEAIYWLGETYLSTNQPREAGEQFLALTKQYASSPKAPSALLKLGTSLANMGAADRACAVFSEVARKYPKASQSFRDEVVREQRRAKCS